MKICQQCLYDAELKPRRDKDAGAARMRHELAACQRAVFQRSHSCGAGCDHPPAFAPRCIQFVRCCLGERVAFRVQMYLLHALYTYRLKCPQSYMQSDICNAHAARANPVEDLRREMQARRGSSDRAALMCI